MLVAGSGATLLLFGLVRDGNPSYPWVLFLVLYPTFCLTKAVGIASLDDLNAPNWVCAAAIINGVLLSFLGSVAGFVFSVWKAKRR